MRRAVLVISHRWLLSITSFYSSIPRRDWHHGWKGSPIHSRGEHHAPYATSSCVSLVSSVPILRLFCLAMSYSEVMVIQTIDHYGGVLTWTNYRSSYPTTRHLTNSRVTKMNHLSVHNHSHVTITSHTTPYHWSFAKYNHHFSQVQSMLNPDLLIGYGYVTSWRMKYRSELTSANTSVVIFISVWRIISWGRSDMSGQHRWGDGRVKAFNPSRVDGMRGNVFLYSTGSITNPYNVSFLHNAPVFTTSWIIYVSILNSH